MIIKLSSTKWFSKIDDATPGLCSTEEQINLRKLNILRKHDIRSCILLSF